MALLEKRKGLAAKLESSYGVDPTIAESTDSIQTRGLTVTPFDADFVSRELDRGTFGAEAEIVVAKRVGVNFEVEAAGAGTAGNAPGYSQLLRSCGFSETIDAGTDVEYTPVSTGFESIYMEVNTDGNQHVAKGAYGTMGLNLSARAIPQMSFEYTGLYVTPTAVSLPTYTLTDFKVPEAVNNANTVTATLLSQTLAMTAFEVSLNNQLEHIDTVGDERIEFVDRQVRGTITFELPLISSYNWFNSVNARTAGALQIVHGDTGGNIFQVDAPNVELSNPQISAEQGRYLLTVDTLLLPSSGNDEIKITVK